MKTYKPISTITYVDKDYLKNVLDGLIMQGDIDFYVFIYHYAESIDGKDHIHLYLVPSHQVESKDLKFTQNELQGTIDYVKTEFANWYFYCCHNKQYLEDKGLVRKYSYGFEDFISSDHQDLLARVTSLDIDNYLSEKYLYQRKIKYAVERGLPFSWLVQNDYIPLNMIHFAEKTYNILTDEKFRLRR